MGIVSDADDGPGVWPEDTALAPDLNGATAAIAMVNGHAATIVAYLRETAHPSYSVLNRIAACLLDTGSGNQRLRFVIRNGRPPLKKAVALARDEASAAAALDLGLEGPIGHYLANGNISERIRLALVDALSPEGTSKWKLVFKRARAGNPATLRRTEIKTIAFGYYAKNLYAQHRKWDAVDQILRKQGLMGDDNATRKRAVRFVNRITSKLEK